MKMNQYTTTAHLYDLDQRDVVKDDINFYLDYANQQNGEILELGCGTGRVSIPLAEAGYNVTGLDLSDSMMRILRQKNDTVTLIKADMADFNIGKKFDMIIVPFRAFQSLTDDIDIDNSLKCVYNHLTDNGIFIVNVFKPRNTNDENWCYPETVQWERYDESGNYVVKKTWGDKIDTVNHIIYPHFAYYVTDKNDDTIRLTEDLQLKYYYENQIEERINKAGMTVTERYGWYDKRSIDEANREIIFVCRKKNIIKEYYNQQVEGEWNRINGRPEFLITCKFIDRYIKPNDKVLDIGGGPGRYSQYLLERDCDVTLFDLSDENVKFACSNNVKLKGIVGDARNVDEYITEKFDHILLMGPMYHLLDESDRIKAINAALKLLKDGGTIFISFINTFAGMIYAMKDAPEIISDVNEESFYATILSDTDFAGQAFTQAFFTHQDNVLPFMKQFPLEKLHYFGQEGITSPCEGNIMNQPKEIIDAWIDFAVKLCEKEHLLSWSEHLMYIGRKNHV